MHAKDTSFSPSSLSLLIMAAKRQIKQLGASGLKAFHLTDQQCMVLETLRETGPICLTELATVLRLDHPTTSRLVHILENRCLLKVNLDPTQRRRVLIHLDEGSQPFLDDLHRLVQEYRARLEEGLSKEEKDILRSCLGKLVANLENMEQELQTGKTGPTA